MVWVSFRREEGRTRDEERKNLPYEYSVQKEVFCVCVGGGGAINRDCTLHKYVQDDYTFFV